MTIHYTLARSASRSGPALLDPSRGVLFAGDVLGDAPATIPGLLAAGLLDQWLARSAEAPATAWQPREAVTFRNPLRGAEKILGIGLNYVAHAADLSAPVPTEPASFPKWPHTLLDPGQPIPLPSDSARVTAEGELALIIGRPCRDVTPDEALDYVFGFVAVLDQTAEDVLQRNPRFLTRSKNYAGFLAAAPEIVPTSEVVSAVGLEDLRVTTFVNDVPGASNTGAAMTFGVRELVSLQSRYMPLLPGDVICTGTPGASVISAGDTVRADVQAVGSLTHQVIRTDPSTASARQAAAAASGV